MSETSSQSNDDLFFNSTVSSYVDVDHNARFRRRDWLAEALDEKLREPGRRFVLLTAEPGAGKSAFIAQLAHDHADWLRYFIRRDQRSVLADVSDKSLLLRIGYQLAALRPELFSPELRLSVVQRIDEVGAQAEAVGAEVKRLTTSPFYQKVIEIEQHVRANQGKTVGLRVEELVVESRVLSAEDLLHLALIDPAKALLRIDSTKQIVILIDALDEIRYHQTTPNILAWLTKCPVLPDNIRFVLTSRPSDGALELFCVKQATYVNKLTIAKDDPRVKGDIKAFVSALVSEKRFAETLHQTAGGAPAFAEKAAAKADGNLGYLDALARGIDHALVAENSLTLTALLNLDALPADLTGLYAFFLNQIKVAVKDQGVPVGRNSETRERIYRPAWLEIYRPILGVLAVAFEPSTLIQLKALGGISAGLEDVGEAVARMNQFLDGLEGGKYRLYHSTVGEFLTARKTAEQLESADLYLNAEEWHRNLAYELQERAETAELWKDINNELEQARRRYGREHYLEHLYAGNDYEGLSRTLDGMTYGLGKLEFDPSGLLFIQDLDLARKSACKHDTNLQATPAKLPVLWRYSLLRCALGGAVAAYPESTLITLAALSRERQAIRLAKLMPNLEAQASALVCIAGMLGQEASKRHETRVLFNDAFGILRRLSGEKQAQVATTILNCLHSLVTQVSWWDDEVIRDWLEVVRTIRDAGVASSCRVHICVLLLKKNDGFASRILQDALTTAETLQEPARSSTLAYVCMTLIECGACAHAQTALVLVAPGDRLPCLCALARRLKKEGEDTQAQSFLTQALVLRESFSEQEKQFALDLDLARTHAELGQIRRAEELLKKAETDISSVPEPTRLNFLCSLAVALDGAGFKREFRSVIARAIAIARRLERSRVPQPGRFYISYLGPVIATFRQLGMPKPAFRLAKQVNTSDRVYVLNDAARAACAAKKWDNALQIIEMIRAVDDGSPYRVRMQGSGSGETVDPFDPPSQALIEICVGLAQSGEWQRAISVSDQITELDAHFAALGAIAQELIAQDRKQDARDVLRRQRVFLRRRGAGFALNDIAVTCAVMLVQNGEWELAKQLIGSARLAESPRRIVFPLLQSLWKSTNWRLAVEIAREIQDASTKVKLLIEIAANIKTDRLAAIELLEESERIPEAVDGNFRVRTALVFASLGERGQAIERLKLAECEFREGGPYFFSPRPLARMPEHYAAVGDLVAASDLAHALDDEYERVYAFQSVAKVTHEGGDEAAALRFLDEAAAAVRQMHLYQERVPDLVESIAGVFAAMGKKDTATELLREFKVNPRSHQEVRLEFGNQLAAGGAFAEAMLTVDKVEDTDDRISARCVLAPKMAQAGETQAAVDQMKRAWREAATHPDARHVTGQLLKVASTLVDMGMTEPALQLVEREWLASDSSRQLTAALAAAGACDDARPKLGFELHEASKWVAEFLERWGNEVEA